MDLKALKDATNEVLKGIDPASIRDAVNWADLRCSMAISCTDQDGSTWYEVIVEEASESASALQSVVNMQLRKRGFAGIVVRTEW